MRRGTTLPELLLVLLLAGVLLALALPALAALHDRLATDLAARALVAAHARARLVARVEQRAVVLDADSARLRLWSIESVVDTVLRWESGGPAAEGVRAAGLPHRMVYGPAGNALGLANVTITLQRGGALRRVIVSRYGRVRLQ